jgi:hypothetical protein
MHRTLDRTDAGDVSCSVSVEEMTFSIPKTVSEVYEIGLIFCSCKRKIFFELFQRSKVHFLNFLLVAHDFNLFQNSTLDQVKQCSRYEDNPNLIYICKQFDLQKIDYKVTFWMMKRVSQPKGFIAFHPGEYN